MKVYTHDKDGNVLSGATVPGGVPVQRDEPDGVFGGEERGNGQIKYGGSNETADFVYTAFSKRKPCGVLAGFDPIFI
jgi:hypothetical protein